MAAGKTPADPAPDLLIASVYLDYRNYRDLGIEFLENALTKETDPARRDAIARRIREARSR